MTKSRNFVPIILIALSFMLNLIWVFTIQPFLAPDEPEHLAAVREIQFRHTLPEIHYDFTSNPKGAPVPPFTDQPLTDAVQQSIGNGVRHRISFESTQAPLYYLTAAVFSWPANNDVILQLYICRIVSALFGALTILFIWAAIRQISPNSPLLALFCATTILILPQFNFNSAYVTNDVALNAVGAATLYVWFKGLRSPDFDRYLFLAGAVTGLAVLTKLTALVMLPPLALVAILRARNIHFAQLALGSAAGFLVVTGWWFVRNIVAYGEWTGFANTVRFYQARSNIYVLDPTNLSAYAEFLKRTFDSTLGVFGWLDVMLDPAIYQIALWICAFFSLISLYRLFRRLQLRSDTRAVVAPIITLLLLTAGLLFAFIAFSVQIGYQTQGRYLFLLLVPYTLLINYGLHKTIQQRSWPSLWGVLPTLLLVALNIYSLIVVATHWA